jgi:hypothetical protein
MNQDELRELVLPMANAALQELMAINAQKPYTNTEYERASHVLDATLMLYTQGDEEYAQALRLASLDTSKSPRYYAIMWTREDLIEHFS